MIIDSPDAPALVVSACWGVFIVAWAVSAWFVKPTVERGGWSWLRLPLIGTALLAWWSLRGSAPGFASARLWDPSAASRTIAAALTLGGLAIALWARWTLGRNWSGAVVIKRDHQLVEDGPYRFVRHPIYTGLLLMALGTAMLEAHTAAFGLCAFIGVALWIKLQAEERLLTRHFPDTYPLYRRRVRALIPFLL